MNKIQNRVKLIGHLGADPEIRTLYSGRKVANFRIATNSSYTNDKGERVEETNGTLLWRGASLRKSAKNTSQKVKKLL